MLHGTGWRLELGVVLEHLPCVVQRFDCLSRLALCLSPPCWTPSAGLLSSADDGLIAMGPVHCADSPVTCAVSSAALRGGSSP
jgi:hypothetical protein